MAKRLVYYMLILWILFVFHFPQLWLAYFLHFKHTGSGGLYDVLINAGLVFLWGFFHSLTARDTIKEPIINRVGSAFYKLFYMSVAGISQCLLLYFYRPLPGVVWDTRGLLYWILTGLFIACILGVFLSSLILDYMEVLGVRGILRHMRNEPEKKPELIVKGPYAFTRHPVYLCTIGMLWMGPVMTVSRLEFAILGTIYIFIGTYFEDRDTKSFLGVPYKEYSDHVPVLFPRLTPWRK